MTLGCFTEWAWKGKCCVCAEQAPLQAVVPACQGERGSDLQRPRRANKVPGIPLVCVAHVQHHSASAAAAFHGRLPGSALQRGRLHCSAQHVLPLRRRQRGGAGLQWKLQG